MFGTSEEMRVEHLQNNSLEIGHTICSVISDGVEVILRPWSGTRYTPPTIQFFSMAMMLLLPAVMSLISNFVQMIPLLQVPHPVGLFSLGDYAKVYFVICAVHGVRKWRRMIDPSREAHSEYEGPALPFFQWLPKGRSFWFVRIVLEPAFVLAVAIVLQDFFIARPSLSLYLKFAALALFIKNFISWFRAWEFLRITMDIGNAAPALAKLMDDQASEAELEPLHLASLPKNIDPEIRKATIAHIARNYMQE
jgi:hypothetical protein